MLNEMSNVLNETTSFKTSVALLIFEKYANATEIQFERIQQDKKALPGPGPGADTKLMITLFSDIHFYFVCIDKVQNLLEAIAKSDGEPSFIELWSRYQSIFKPYNDARNHLEHIEDRIKEKKYLSDLGNLHNNTYTFGGEPFDISRKGLDTVIESYNDVYSLLKERKKSKQDMK